MSDLERGHALRLKGKFQKSLVSYRRHIKSANDELSRADGQCGAAMAARGMCRYGQALRLFDSAHEIYRLVDDDEGLAFVLYGRGGVRRYLGDFALARRDLESALQLAPDALSKAFTLMALGGLSRMTGNFSDSLIFYKSALATGRRRRDRYVASYAECGVGNAYRMMNNEAKARKYLALAEEGYRCIRDSVSRPYTVIGVSLMDIALGRKGRVAEARRMFERSEDGRGLIYADIADALGEFVGRKNGSSASARRFAMRGRSAARKLGLKLEYAHADYLLSVITGKPDLSAYRELGLGPPAALTAIP